MISIITICRNDVYGLEKTYRSVSSQIDKYFEWIVIDGASSDGTLELLRSVALEEGVFKYKSEADAGIYDAMEKGLRECTGDYVLFLNAGDTLSSPESTRTINKSLAECPVDVYFFSARIVVNGFAHLRRPRPLSSSRYSVPAIQQATIYRKDVLTQLEWPRNFKICGDMFISAQLLARRCTSWSKDIEVSVFELGGVSTQRPILLMKEAWLIQRDVLSCSLGYRLITAARRVSTGFAVKILYRLNINRSTNSGTAAS